MSEGELLQPPAPEEVPPRLGEPFWGYQDLFVFFASGVPCLLAAALVVKAVFLMLGRHTAAQTPELLASQFLGYIFWFTFLYLLLRLKYKRAFWTSLGWTGLFEDWVRRLGWGVFLAVGVALLGAALRTPDLDMPMKRLMSDPLSVLLIGIASVSVGPVCEEIAFRGFLMPLLVRSLGSPAGILLSALPFSLLHGPQYAWSWRHLLLITLAGAAFGLIRLRTGSTAAAAVSHASYNATFFLGYIYYGKGTV